MATLKTLITIIFVLVCIALSIVILMQEGKNNGLGALSGASDSYFDKNRGRTKSGKLLNITKILAVLFLLLSAVLNLNFDRPTTETSETVTVTATPEATEEVASTEEATNTEEVTATEEATEVVE